MAAQGRQVREGRFERQRASLLQQGQPRETRVESPTARGRFPQGLLLCAYDRDEKETHVIENRERPEQSD